MSSSPGPWQYTAYKAGVLELAVTAANDQAVSLEPVSCVVREEEEGKKGVLTNAEANKLNGDMHRRCTSLGKFIEDVLIKGRLSTDCARLQDHEKALHVMAFTHRRPDQDNGPSWLAKLSQMFIEDCIVNRDQPKEDGLKALLESISITNPIDSETKQIVTLSGAEAYQQKLTLSHINHLQDGGYLVSDANPNNVHLENFDVNKSKQSCSRYFWRRDCQCERTCDHRCALLDRNRFENEVQDELVMVAGHWPELGEAGVREKIADAFTAHHKKYGQNLPDYLSDENRSELLSCKYGHLERMRRRRFDMNAKGRGIYCPRQDTFVTFMEVLRGEKSVPKGMIESLDEQLRELTPVKATVQVTIDPASVDRSVPGSRFSQEDVDKENLHQFQRILAMSATLKMVASGDMVFDHPDMANEERLVNAVLNNGSLGTGTGVQLIGFHSNKFRNRYMEGINKLKFNVSLPRLLKTLQIYFDHHEAWLGMSPSHGEFGDDEVRRYADPQQYLNHTSIRSPQNGPPLTPQQAAAQVLHASHLTHPDVVRYTNSIEPQMGGLARDANPDNTLLENASINLHRGVCSKYPLIPCTKRCQCHPTHRCKPLLYKLDERYFISTVIVESQLGMHGKYPGPEENVSSIQEKVLQEIRAAYECQRKQVPTFVTTYEECGYGDFLTYACAKPTCTKTYKTIEEANHCCSEEQQVSNQDNRVQLTTNQITSDEQYQAEVLGLIKKWGGYGGGYGRKELIKGKTSFKFINQGLNALLLSTRFHKYCGDNDAPLDVLKKCTGETFGFAKKKTFGHGWKVLRVCPACDGGYEFDNPSFGYSDHPELYILAFRKIVTDCRKGLSAEAQARVMFVWHSWGAPMASAKLNLHSFYPGDAYVDWIGVSIFQQVLPWSPPWGGQVSDVENVLKFAQEHDKPTMIAESTPFGGIELKQASKAAEESMDATSDPWDRWYGQVIGIIDKYDVSMWCYINCDWESQPQWHNVGFGETRLASNKEVMTKWHEQIMSGKSNRTFLHLGALDNCGATIASSNLGTDSDEHWFTPDHFLSFILVPFIVASAAFFLPYYMLGGIRGRVKSTTRERRPLLADINEKS